MSVLLDLIPLSAKWLLGRNSHVLPPLSEDSDHGSASSSVHWDFLK